MDIANLQRLAKDQIVIRGLMDDEKPQIVVELVVSNTYFYRQWGQDATQTAFVRFVYDPYSPRIPLSNFKQSDLVDTLLLEIVDHWESEFADAGENSPVLLLGRKDRKIFCSQETSLAWLEVFSRILGEIVHLRDNAKDGTTKGSYLLFFKRLSALIEAQNKKIEGLCS